MSGETYCTLSTMKAKRGNEAELIQSITVCFVNESRRQQVLEGWSEGRAPNLF